MSAEEKRNEADLIINKLCDNIQNEAVTLMYSMYSAFRKEGASEHEALELTKILMLSAIARGESK